MWYTTLKNLSKCFSTTLVSYEAAPFDGLSEHYSHRSEEPRGVICTVLQQVLREVSAGEVAHTAVAVSRSGRVVFTGTSSGTIRAIKYPLPIQKEWIMYQAHCGPVTKMVITCDDQFLLTASEDGCLLMWKIIDKEGRGLKSNRQIIHTEEILVTKSDLEEKKQSMLELKMRLEELQKENEYKLLRQDMTSNRIMKEHSDTFTQQIESLKAMQQAMKTEMEKQVHEHQQSSAEVTVKHSKELKDLELSYSQKLIVEHERYQDLQHKYQIMQEGYERQLKTAEESRIQALQDLTQLYEAKLQDKTHLLAQCQEDAQQQISEFKETIRQAQQDEERIIHNIQIEYETKLHTEKETHTNLKGETVILKQKSYSLQRQIDDRSTDIKKLKQERKRLKG